MWAGMPWDWYEANAAAVVPYHEAADPVVLGACLRDPLPSDPADVLDIGGGIGRDAAWPAGLDHDMVAADPASVMRLKGMRRHPEPRILRVLISLLNADQPPTGRKRSDSDFLSHVKKQSSNSGSCRRSTIMREFPQQHSGGSVMSSVVKNPKILVLGGSKGGCGRSSCARNLLIAAAQAGLKVIGIDTDEQRTFSKWRQRRIKAQQKLPQIFVPDVLGLAIEDLGAIERAMEGHDLVVIDTAPTVEENMRSTVELCRRASLVLVPTSPTHDDLESVAPWLVTLKKEGCNTEFLLNKANRRTRSFEMARSKLVRHGRLAPVEIPSLEDLHMPHGNGLAAVDFERNKAGSVMQDLWAHVRQEVSL